MVYLAGMPSEMDNIIALSENNGFYDIENCVQAYVAKYKGRNVGSMGQVGLIELTLMKSWTEYRQRNAKQLNVVAGEFQVIRLGDVPEHSEHAEYKHYMFIKPEF